MRWYKQSFAVGTVRTITKFAWRPIICDDGTVVWLEKYHQRQILERSTRDLREWYEQWRTVKTFAH